MYTELHIMYTELHIIFIPLQHWVSLVALTHPHNLLTYFFLNNLFNSFFQVVGIKAQEDTNEEDDELHAILLQAESSDALYVLTYLHE